MRLFLILALLFSSVGVNAQGTRIWWADYVGTSNSKNSTPKQITIGEATYSLTRNRSCIGLAGTELAACLNVLADSKQSAQPPVLIHVPPGGRPNSGTGITADFEITISDGDVFQSLNTSKTHLISVSNPHAQSNILIISWEKDAATTPASMVLTFAAPITGSPTACLIPNCYIWGNTATVIIPAGTYTPLPVISLGVIPSIATGTAVVRSNLALFSLYDDAVPANNSASDTNTVLP